jgi:hypothetical protein
MKINIILSQIDLGSMALPEFQRGYVWNRDQVRDLMYSLYRKHPVGSLLVWSTKTEIADTRGDSPPAPGVVKLLLDGQQRITSPFGIIRRRPPAGGIHHRGCRPPLPPPRDPCARRVAPPERHRRHRPGAGVHRDAGVS